jgi:hypothetical protein
MYQKQKGLAMNRENHKEIYVTEIKTVSLSSAARVMKKRGNEK